MSNSSIWPIDRNLSGAITPGQSGSGSVGNEEILHIPQHYRSLTIRLFTVISRTFIGWGSLTPLQRCSLYSTAPTNSFNMDNLDDYQNCKDDYIFSKPCYLNIDKNKCKTIKQCQSLSFPIIKYKQFFTREFKGYNRLQNKRKTNTFTQSRLLLYWKTKCI